MFRKSWTPEELEMLANHVVPPKRSVNAARNKASRLGIPFTPSDSDAHPSVLPEYNSQVSTWTDKEIDLLRKGKLPKGRSRQAAYEKAFRLGISFNPVRNKKTPQKERAILLHDEIVAELKRTGNMRATASKFGLAYTTIRNIAKSTEKLDSLVQELDSLIESSSKVQDAEASACFVIDSLSVL